MLTKFSQKAHKNAYNSFSSQKVAYFLISLAISIAFLFINFLEGSKFSNFFSNFQFFRYIFPNFCLFIVLKKAHKFFSMRHLTLKGAPMCAYAHTIRHSGRGHSLLPQSHQSHTSHCTVVSCKYISCCPVCFVKENYFRKIENIFILKRILCNGIQLLKLLLRVNMVFVLAPKGFCKARHQLKKVP